MPEKIANNIPDPSDTSKLTTPPPKDTAALERRSVFVNVSSHGSGTYKPSPAILPLFGEDTE